MKNLAAAVTLALLATFTATPAAAAPPPPPKDDSFFVPPAGYQNAKPGTVLRSRPADLALFSVIPEPGVKAWQVLFRSTGARREPVAASGLLLLPEAIPLKDRPLVAYQMAEDSLDAKCAPSHMLQQGVFPDNIVAQAELLLINGLLKNGWAVVVTDHEGPKSAYGVGQLAGRITLDAVRAAESFGPLGLDGAKTPVGLWGYSGGAIATGWAGELQPSYAPELDVRGVAAGGVPADLTSALRNLDGGPFGGYALGGALGAGRAYPELGRLIDSILTPRGRELAGRIGSSCNSLIVVQGLFQRLDRITTVKDPISLPLVKEVLADNKMGRDVPRAPTLFYHSVNDELIPIGPVDETVRSYCRRGARITYRRDLLSEHILLAGTGAPYALAWLKERMAGGSVPAGCTTTTTLTALSDPAATAALRDYLSGLGPLFTEKR